MDRGAADMLEADAHSETTGNVDEDWQDPDLGVYVSVVPTGDVLDLGDPTLAPAPVDPRAATLPDSSCDLLGVAGDTSAAPADAAARIDLTNTDGEISTVLLLALLPHLRCLWLIP